MKYLSSCPEGRTRLSAGTLAILMTMLLGLLGTLAGCASLKPHPYTTCESGGYDDWSPLPKPPPDAAQLRAKVEEGNINLESPRMEAWYGREDGRLALCQPAMFATELDTPSGRSEVSLVGTHCTEFCRQWPRP